MKNLVMWALVVGALSLVGPAWGEDKPTKKTDVPQTIVLDLSKLPPEVAAKLLKLAAGVKKPDAAEGSKKPIKGEGDKKPVEGGKKPVKGEGDKKPEGVGAYSLAHAIAQVEKGGKGTVVKGERTEGVYVLTLESGEVIKITATKAPEKKGVAGGKKGAEGGKKKGTEGGKKKEGAEGGKKGLTDPNVKKPAK